MAQFTASCPYCKQQFTAQTEWIGQQTKCPICGKIFTISMISQNNTINQHPINSNSFPICLDKKKEGTVLFTTISWIIYGHSYELSWLIEEIPVFKNKFLTIMLFPLCIALILAGIALFFAINSKIKACIYISRALLITEIVTLIYIVTRMII